MQHTVSMVVHDAPWPSRRTWSLPQQAGLLLPPIPEQLCVCVRVAVVAADPGQGRHGHGGTAADAHDGIVVGLVRARAGRRRWVVFADKFDYNPTSVPPEWHGWVNYINDYEPTHHNFKEPIYHLKATATKTATPEAYNPKGSWYNEQKRNWRKYEAWQPPQA